MNDTIDAKLIDRVTAGEREIQSRSAREIHVGCVGEKRTGERERPGADAGVACVSAGARENPLAAASLRHGSLKTGAVDDSGADLIRTRACAGERESLVAEARRRE